VPIVVTFSVCGSIKTLEFPRRLAAVCRNSRLRKQGHGRSASLMWGRPELSFIRRGARRASLTAWERLSPAPMPPR
jgi:hypothetical protein